MATTPEGIFDGFERGGELLSEGSPKVVDKLLPLVVEFVSDGIEFWPNFFELLRCSRMRWAT